MFRVYGIVLSVRDHFVLLIDRTEENLSEKYVVYGVLPDGKKRALIEPTNLAMADQIANTYWQERSRAAKSVSPRRISWLMKFGKFVVEPEPEKNKDEKVEHQS